MHRSTPDTHAISGTQNTHTQTDASIQHLEAQLWSEKKTDPWAAKFLQTKYTYNPNLPVDFEHCPKRKVEQFTDAQC